MRYKALLLVLLLLAGCGDRAAPVVAPGPPAGSPSGTSISQPGHPAGSPSGTSISQPGHPAGSPPGATAAQPGPPAGSPPGATAAQPETPAAPAPAPAATPKKDLVLDQWQGSTLFLERKAEAAILWLRVKDQSPRQIAELPAVHPLTAIWHHRLEKRLLLAIPADDIFDQLFRIDLGSGAVTELGKIMGERFRFLALSPDGRYLAQKHNGLPHAMELIDADTGARTTPGDEAQVGSFAWAPQGSTWAIRAAHEGSGLPVEISFRWREGASHLDIGAAGGEVRHLHPPEPLMLVGGPVWSPDGARIAVASGTIPEGAGQPEEQTVWAVNTATGEWSKLYDLQPGETLSIRRQQQKLWP